MDILLIPAVLTVTECHPYVGGKTFWEELEAVYGDAYLKPLRSVGKNRSYLRETVDKVLRLAEAEGKLSDRTIVDEALARRKRKQDSEVAA
jgi:KaiC/GvpD/RAD55 family RecA-like ATPase